MNCSFDGLVLKLLTHHRSDWEVLGFFHAGESWLSWISKGALSFDFYPESNTPFCIFRSRISTIEGLNRKFLTCGELFSRKFFSFFPCIRIMIVWDYQKENEQDKFISILKQTFLRNYRPDFFKQSLNRKCMPLWRRKPLETFIFDTGIKTLTVSNFPKVLWLLMILHNQIQNNV